MNYWTIPDRRQIHDSVGSRVAFPLAFLGSLIAIALLLYAVDTTPLRALIVTS
jgi:hypothetical protein